METLRHLPLGNEIDNTPYSLVRLQYVEYKWITTALSLLTSQQGIQILLHVKFA